MIPAIGIGTFRLSDEQARAAVTSAIEMGYRHIDTAQMYENERGVGQAVRESGVPRQDLFVTTKVWHNRLRHEDLISSLKDSLVRLGMETVDLTLVHWPSPGGEVPIAETMAALSEARRQGLTRHIGLSNFTVPLLDEALDCDGGQDIVTNQIEVHPFLRNRALVEHCQARGLRVTAYMPLATGKVMENPVMQSIAERHDASPAQVALAWLLARDLIVIPSSTKAEHLRANLAAQSLELTPDEMAEINGLDANDRIADPSFAPDWNRSP